MDAITNWLMISDENAVIVKPINVDSVVKEDSGYAWMNLSYFVQILYVHR